MNTENKCLQGLTDGLDTCRNAETTSVSKVRSRIGRSLNEKTAGRNAHDRTTHATSTIT